MLEMLKYDVMTALFEEKYAQLQEQGDTEIWAPAGGVL